MEIRKVRLQHEDAKELARRIARSVLERFGKMWNAVDDEAVRWCPADTNENVELGSGQESPDKDMHEPRRTLLFHVAAMLDVNECSLDFLDMDDEKKEKYFDLLCAAVVREACELDGEGNISRDKLRVVYGLFHDEMLKTLAKKGRRSPDFALRYWKDLNNSNSLISPLPFNRIAKAAMSSQASSASAERLFSDLGRMEGDQRQSLLSGTMEMAAVVRHFAIDFIRQVRPAVQSNLLHPDAAAFKKLVEYVSNEIV